MAQFIITFHIHIDETRRPKDQNFKPVYKVIDNVEVPNDHALAQFINTRFEGLTHDPGITVFVDQTSIMPTGTGNVGNRMFIPWHMITHFHAEIQKVPEVQNEENNFVPTNEEPTPEKETVQ